MAKNPQHEPLISECQRIIDSAKADSRDLTPEECRKIDSHLARMDAMDRIANYENQPDNQKQFPSDYEWEWNGQKYRGLEPVTNNAKPSSRQWQDRHGNPVQVFNAGQPWANPVNKEEALLNIGNLIRAVASGDSRFMQREAKVLNAMSGGVNTGGGYLVPDQIAGFVIDKARAASALAQAGTVFVPMESDSMTLAKVVTDPSFATHMENQTITESDITFGAVGFVARTIATIVRISRELAADAPNIGELVSGVLARAFAAEIDRQGIAGDGSQDETGLTIYPGISETTSVGAIEWADIHNAAISVRAANYQPNAYIVSPTIGGDLDITTATGSGNWLGAPPSVANLARYETSNISNAFGIVGDFTQSAFGLRQGALLEATTTGNDAFNKHSLLIKLTWRGCFRVMQPGAFHRLTGITT